MIDFKIGGPARIEPYQIADRQTPPTGVSVPRPFDIRHMLRPPQGRTTGGSYALSEYDSMEWAYSLGDGSLYQQLIALYDPVNSWKWIYFYDMYSNTGRWCEGVMHEPQIVRLGGNVVANITILFTSLSFI